MGLDPLFWIATISRVFFTRAGAVVERVASRACAPAIFLGRPAEFRADAVSAHRARSE